MGLTVEQIAVAIEVAFEPYNEILEKMLERTERLEAAYARRAAAAEPTRKSAEDELVDSGRGYSKRLGQPTVTDAIRKAFTHNASGIPHPNVQNFR